MEKLLYKDLSYHIRHCLFEVQNVIGVGFDEETYHQALARKFKREGILCSSKARKMLTHRGVSIREYILDFLIEDKIIVSLKCLPCDFLKANYIQLFAELKLWEKHLGLIVNYGLPRLNIERMVFYEKLLLLEEDYEFIKHKMTESNRKIMKQIRKSLLHVGKMHGLGYSKPIVRRLVEVELEYQKLAFERDLSIPVNYLGETIRNYKMRDLLIEDSILLSITALQKTITHYDISKVKSYLRNLNLNLGLVVNYGKSSIEIKGIFNE